MCAFNKELCKFILMYDIILHVFSMLEKGGKMKHGKSGLKKKKRLGKQEEKRARKWRAGEGKKSKGRRR